MYMSKILQVNLAFTADTSAALNNLQKLRTSLNEIAALPLTLGKGNINADIQRAAASAQKLQQHLGAAMDIKTGNLNLSKLEHSLKSSNTSLSTLTTNLLHAGSAGEQAFLSTYSAVAQANMQLRQANGLAAQFMTTLKNTVKWQLSSSLIHGVISGFQKAIGYAKELDTSLNNIRIVTNYSSDHMASFAKQANEAAKALKTTTTAYTDAALIYYQQGLEGKAVEERTKTTIKLANVTGESAQTVSEWMTAIWNNFDDGSKSLEYYADVMTALGAATASSSKEIAAGLEKFAAVADTVGLSYENATAALATITSETRQSADVVGTALKTLFARIQDLELGKTLEDGTTLGRYSEALKKVGVNIQTSNGDLKEMDAILEEMGNKWKLLDRGQQVALAKSVAGIRQYTQLIALMDNFDFYKQNQTIAATAEGTLEDQQKIFEENWKAASQQLKASAEDLYGALIPKDFIIDFTNGLSTLVSGISDVVEAFGGMKTIMLLLATVVLSKFQANMSMAINTGIEKVQNLVSSLQQLKQNGLWSGIKNKAKSMWTEAGKSDVQRTKEHLNDRTTLQQDYTKGLNKALHMKDSSGQPVQLSSEFTAQIKNLQTIDKYNVQLLNLQNKMTANEKEQLSTQLQQIKALGDEYAALQKKTGELTLQSERLKDQASIGYSAKAFSGTDTRGNKLAQSDYALNKGERVGFTLAAMDSGAKYARVNDSSQETAFGSTAEGKEAAIKSLDIVKQTAQAHQEVLNLKQTEIKLNKTDLDNYIDKLNLTDQQKRYLKDNASTLDELVVKTKDLEQGAQSYSASLKNSPSIIAEMANNGRQYANTQSEVNATLEQQNTLLNTLKKNIKDIVQRGRTIGSGIITSLQGIGQAAMGINMLTSAFASLKEQIDSGNVTFAGILGFITSMSMAIPMLVNSISTLGKVFNTENLILLANTLIKWENNRESRKAAKISGEEAVANKAEEKTLEQLNEEELKNLALKKANNGNYYQKGRRGAISGKTPVSNISTPSSGQTTMGPQPYQGQQLAIMNSSAAQGAGKTAAAKGGSKALVSSGGKALGTVASYVVPILVAVAIMGVGIKLMVDAFNKAEKAAKQAKENAALLKKEYEGVVQESQKLTENIDKYTEGNKKLDGLVKGTHEYKQALLESNEAAMELIKSNKELQKEGAYEVINGEIVINQDALDKAKEEQLLQQQDALARSNRAEISSQQAQYDVKKDNALKDMDLNGYREMDEGTGYGVAGAALGTAAGVGLAVGLANGWNPVGWVILALGGIAAVGSLIAGAVEGNSTETEEAIVEHLSEQYQDNPDMFASKDKLKEALGPDYEHLRESLWENKDQMEELIQSNAELILQEELLRQQIATAAVQRLFGDDLDARQQDAVTKATADIIGSDKVTKAEEDLLEEIEGQDGLVEDLYNYFNKDAGTTVSLGVDDKATISYADGTTEETTQTAIAKSAASQMAQAAASGDVEALKKINQIIENASGVSKGNEGDIKALMKDLDITDEMKEAAAQVAQQSSVLDNIEAFSGNKNSVAHSQVLTAIQNGKKDIEDTDFSFLTRAELVELQNNIQYFDQETQKIIQKGISTYEEQRARANMKANEIFDSEKYELEDRTNIITKAGLNDTEFEAFASTIATTYGLAEEQAEELAEANLRVKNGLTGLQESYKTYGQYLNASYKGTLNYSKGIAAIQKNMNDWFGVMFDAKTIEQNLPDIEAALSGDVKAIERLQNLAAKELILDIDLPGAQETAVLDAIIKLQNTEVEVGMTLDTTQAGQALKNLYIQMLDMGLMTTKQVQSSLEALGYEVNTKTEEKDKIVTILGMDIKYGSEEIETIDWKNTKYKGKFSNQAIDFMPEKSETSSEKSKRYKKLDEEIKRYRLLKETVEDLKRNLDNIGKAKDRAYGQAKIGYMQAERKELERNVELAKERLRLAEEYYQQDLQELSQYGIHANKDGQIENWDEILQKQINKMKSMDPNSDAYKDEEQRLDDMKSAYDKYMQSLDDVKDAQQEIIDKQNAVIDSLLEEAEFTVEFKIEADEFTMSILEHFLSRLEDDAFAAADAIALIGQQMEVTAGQIDTYMQGINNVLGATLSPEEIQKVMVGDLSNIDTSKLTEQQIEDLKEYANGLMEVENQLREQHTAVHEKLTESIEAWNEEFDKNMAKFEKYNAVVENYKNIIDIVGKGTLGISDETMRNMYEAQKNIATDQLEAARIRKESAQTTYDEMKIAYDNAVMQYGEDSEIAKKWKEQMDIAEENLDEATSEFQDAWQNALQAAADAFQHNVETIIQNFEKSIAGIYGSLEALEEAFDRQKEINERYLEDYEKTYEINKLNRKINQDIAKTTSNKSTKELRDLQNELLNMNKEGNQISKLDIEYMQKKYDLLLAEQALRDAQNAKSTVKLSRDSEGNYSYVYTADQNNVDQAMQSYEDAKYALEDWSRTSLETVSENIIQIYSAWSQAMQEIMMDNTLNEEERERKMAETNQYYLELMGYYTDEATKLTEYGYQTNSQYHIDMADSINDSIVGHIMPDITNWKELYTKSSTLMQGSTTALDKLIKQFAIDVDEAMNKAGISTGKFETLATEDLRNVETQAGSTKNAITKIKTEAEAQLPLAVGAAKTFETKFNICLQGIIDKIGDPTGGGVLGAIQKLINGCKEGLAAQKALEEKDYSYTGGTITSTATGENGGNEIITSSNGDDEITTPSITSEEDEKSGEYTLPGARGWFGTTYRKLYTKNADGNWILLDKGYAAKNNYNDAKITKYATSTFTISNDSNKKTHIIEITKANGAKEYMNFTDVHDLYGGVAAYFPDNWNDFVKKMEQANVPTFDTGGYTGSWGPEGRLAMLHQKEIVLNAHDTENLLSIVSMVRDMNDRIELNARAMQYGLTAAYTANNIKSQNDTLQQEVHITAEFPNATNHSEIEEAFRNLTNLASQYANRKF